jgi:asparagine synthase (glutamine-hydrolysing)
VWLGPLDPSDVSDLFHEPIPVEELYAEAIEQWEACPQDNLVDKTLQFYTKLYLQDDILVKADRASMMNSLEVRAPYLDVDLVDFVRRIPHRYKYRRGSTKYLLKKSLETVLPNKILYRSKKGFGVPIGKWFAEGRLTVREDGGPMNNASFIRKKVVEHRAGRSDHRMFLWNHWLFDIWREAFGQQS